MRARGEREGKDERHAMRNIVATERKGKMEVGGGEGRRKMS